jgi:putative ABC transport system permease protein
MFRNYLMIAWRNLLKNKGYSFINIGGLATGMTVAMLIGLWMYDELSFNKQFDNHNRIAQVMQNQTFNGEVETWYGQAMQLAPELRSSYGKHFKYIVRSSYPRSLILSTGEKHLTKTGNYMEPQAPDMLTLTMLKGTRQGLNDPSSILLSSSVARALFGDKDPMNQVLKINNKLNVKVTGVYEDLPSNSSFADLTFIAPWELMVKDEDLEKRVGWGNSWFQTFVQIADNANMENVTAAIKKVKEKFDPDGPKFKPELFLFPMDRWYLYSEFKNGISTGGRIQFVWLFGIIGVFVLLLACINFMNLSTARSEKRAKEVGIRKAIGSMRGQLIIQFLGESLLVAVFSFILSIFLAALLLPWFNQIADKEISLPLLNPVFWITGIGFSFLTGVIAGSYPAFYLSSFKPVKVLKGTFRVSRFAAVPRKVLVVVQFAVSVTLIICTIVVFRQIQFAKNRPIGYSRAGLITLPLNTEDIRKNYDVFRNDLLATGSVAEVAQSESTVTNAFITNSGFQWKGKDPDMQDQLTTVGVTHEFGNAVNWKMKEGRDFSKAFATDSSGFILNETAVKYMGLKNPLGENIKAFGRTYTVIGVVKDMVMQSIYDPVKPMVFYIDMFNRVVYINIKMNPRVSAAAALAKIEAVYKKHNPAAPFEYTFADEEFEAKYRSEERIGKLSSVFAILAIFISCIGLLGLASFSAEQRTKEIGIRKVLGASVLSVWNLLSKDFVILVIIALLIAIPTAYYFMYNWLQNYQYRTNISWWIFVSAGVGALAITLLTVSFQAIKAATSNPVKSLRTE